MLLAICVVSSKPVVGCPAVALHICGQSRERDRTMSQQPPARPTGKQSAEPEIIPPSVRVRLRDRDAWTSVNERGTHRMYVTRLGPFNLVLLALGIGLFSNEPICS